MKYLAILFALTAVLWGLVPGADATPRQNFRAECYFYYDIFLSDDHTNALKVRLAGTMTNASATGPLPFSLTIETNILRVVGNGWTGTNDGGGFIFTNYGAGFLGTTNIALTLASHTAAAAGLSTTADTHRAWLTGLELTNTSQEAWLTGLNLSNGIFAAADAGLSTTADTHRAWLTGLELTNSLVALLDGSRALTGNWDWDQNDITDVRSATFGTGTMYLASAPKGGNFIEWRNGQMKYAATNHSWNTSTMTLYTKFQFGGSTRGNNIALGRYTTYGDLQGGYGTVLGDNVVCNTVTNNRVGVSQDNGSGYGWRYIKLSYQDGFQFHGDTGNTTADTLASNLLAQLSLAGEWSVGTNGTGQGRFYSYGESGNAGKMFNFSGRTNTYGWHRGIVDSGPGTAGESVMIDGRIQGNGKFRSGIWGSDNLFHFDQDGGQDFKASDSLVIGANFIGVNTNVQGASEALHVVGGVNIDTVTDALVLPRVTTAQMVAISAIEGMLVYSTSSNVLAIYNGSRWENQ